MHILQEITNPNMKHNIMNKYERKGDGKVVVMHNDKDQVEITDGPNKGTWIRSDRRIVIPAGIDVSKLSPVTSDKTPEPVKPVITPNPAPKK